jgi:mono/diheme cytochrome c family protein
MAALCVATSLCMSAENTSQLVLHKTRQSKSDLEIGGSIKGVPKGQTRFVSYDDLLKLPQVNYVVTDDPNFGKAVEVSGVLLETLVATLSSAPGGGMVIAICDDNYDAHYPSEYMRVHQPLLVLRVNGKQPAEWPIGADGFAMGPYMISHPFFKPSFQVLKHTDEAQVPWGLVRLDFRDEREVYAPIQPGGQYATATLAPPGFVIAKQNCFRCHSRDGEGGTKSDVSWSGIARHAVKEPDYFDAYVRDPKAINPDSQMAASPQYDAATLRALRAYFADFAEKK